MKICVLGNGIIAHDFKRMNYETIDCDFRDFKIEYILDFDVIINSYGYKPKDNSPEEMSNLKKCNIDLPFKLSEYCDTRNKRYVQLSTGRLYTGKTNPAKEGDHVCGCDVYSASKFIAESGCHKKDLIIRTKNVFNDQAVTENELFQAIINSTPTKNLESYTWTVDLIRSVTSLLKHKVHGLVNVTSSGVTSQSEICKELGITNIAPTLDKNLSKYAILDISKLEQYIIPTDVNQNIIKCFENLKNNLENNE